VIELDQVTPDLIGECWWALEPLFQQAIEAVSTDWTTDFIRSEAEASRMMLWAIYERDKPLPLLGAAGTSIRHVRGEKVSVIAHCAGRDMSRWLGPVLEKFEALAKANGCSRIECEGRLGWSRALPGYKPVRIVMEKVL
jgi:hypothetical protein